MKTELLALIDDLVKFKLHAADGKFSAEKDARQIRSNIEFLLGQPQSPEFDFAAKLKLEDLLARGYTVSGLALEKPAADGRSERGFITAGGFVGWWRDGGEAVAEPTRQALRDLVDATWSKCTASSEVPGTPLADLLIDGVFPGTEAPIALTLAELLEIRRAGEDFESHGETDVDGELLLRGAQAGYLECMQFQMLDESALDCDIQAAQAIQKPDPT